MWLLSQNLLILALLSSSYVVANSLLSLQPSYSCLDHERSAFASVPVEFHHRLCHPYAYTKLKSWGKGSPDCCTWDGVECNKDTGHVIELDLSSSCLYSTVPISSSLLNLHHLESLNLGYNNFSYPEILHAVGQLGKLSILNLSNSVFSGQIPSEISTPSSLCVLDLALNSDPLGHYSLLELQHPSLEELVGNLTTLTELHLAEVDISSTVPIV